MEDLQAKRALRVASFRATTFFFYSDISVEIRIFHRLCEREVAGRDFRNITDMGQITCLSLHMYSIVKYMPRARPRIGVKRERRQHEIRKRQVPAM